MTLCVFSTGALRAASPDPAGVWYILNRRLLCMFDKKNGFDFSNDSPLAEEVSHSGLPDPWRGAVPTAAGPLARCTSNGEAAANRKRDRDGPGSGGTVPAGCSTEFSFRETHVWA